MLDHIRVATQLATSVKVMTVIQLYTYSYICLMFCYSPNEIIQQLFTAMPCLHAYLIIYMLTMSWIYLAIYKPITLLDSTYTYSYNTYCIMHKECMMLEQSVPADYEDACMDSPIAICCMSTSTYITLTVVSSCHWSIMQLTRLGQL